MTYSLYIDESGDIGIEQRQIERGACPLFFMGGYIIHEQDKQSLLDLITECRQTFNNVNLIHFTNLKHHQKIYFCRKISDFPIHVFGLISDKSELDRGNYRSQIEGENDKFYNKNTHYFLETICKYCQENDIEISNIVFEKQDGKNYESLKNYIRVIQRNPINARARYLNHIVAGNINALTKHEEPLLQVSDAIAHSFYRLCIPDRYNLCEPAYIEEIKNLIPANTEGLILETGIKIVPDYQSLSANDSVKEYIRSMNSEPAIRY